MKAISIQQPWATLVCAGIKDIENRSWKPKELPMRVLVVASSRRVPLDEENTPYCWFSSIANNQTMDNLGFMREFPTSAVVGAVTIVDAVEQLPEEYKDSVWADAQSQYKWILKDAVMFREPITGIKGKLHFFDVPEVDENNLPEIKPMNKIHWEGNHIFIPVNEFILDELIARKAAGVRFTADGVIEYDFIDENGELRTADTVTFYYGDRELEAPVDYIEAFDETDEEDNFIEYDLPNGDSETLTRIVVAFK